MTEMAADHRCGFAALIGRSNVGKSTLINQIVGEKVAIVSSLPQTTRQRVLGVKTLEEGQIAFIDSPGYHRPHDSLGAMMLERAEGVAAEADVILLMVDASKGIGPGDRFVFEQLDPFNQHKPVILVLNQVDLMNKAKTLPMIEMGVEQWGCVEVVPISAKTGDNCDRLLERVLAHLPVGPRLFPPEYLTDQPEKTLAAEIVREKLLARLHEEVPYAVAVVTERMGRRDDGLLEIHATIHVERESHKGIVIGAKGSMIKSVGQAAREELEERFGGRIFLDLRVRVSKAWRERMSTWRDLQIL
jgi:GTPase